MSDVFLSYKREEREKVEILAEALKRLGLDVWFDTELAVGDAFGRVINEQLRSAAAIVVCWSRGAADSDWVQGEAHKAHARGVYVSAKLEECDPPVPFNAFQDADLITWSGSWHHEGLKALITKIAKLAKHPVADRYATFLEDESAAIEQAIAGDGDDPDDVDPINPVPEHPPSYLLDYVARNPQAGSKELGANLAQLAFEEEILKDESTRWIVDGNNTTGQSAYGGVVLNSLRDAIERASPGDTIAIMPGVYRGRFTIEKDLRLVGFGSKDARPVLTGDDNVAVVDIKGNVRLENLVLESRDSSHALCVSGGSPLLLRCFFDRQQLAKTPEGCVHISGNATPTLLACTIYSRYCPGIYFATNAKGSLIGTDIVANDADSVVLQSRARPSFDRCEIRANNGNAVVSLHGASGRFESCALRASYGDVIVNHSGAYSKFVGNRISVRRGSLIDLKEAARGVFERNKVEPDPEARAHWEERERERRKLFRNPDIMKRVIRLPITAAGYHRAKFAQNRLPDGTDLNPATPFGVH